MAKVLVKITGRLAVEVPDSLDVAEAALLANEKAGEADFGELFNIDWNAIVYEDSHGNRTKIGGLV